MSSTLDRQNQTNVHAEGKHPDEPTKLTNTFSGTFNTAGGKMISGNVFNSGGGAMSF